MVRTAYLNPPTPPRPDARHAVVHPADFLSAYSAVNQGHCHPALVRVMAQQAGRLTLTSRAFYNDQLGPFVSHLNATFGYERTLPMNSGVEAGETALKLARRWGYDVKGVVPNAATVLFAHGNFWGRSVAAISSSDDPDSYSGFGPLLGGVRKVAFGDADKLDTALATDGNIVAFMVEPVQGEAGVVVPPAGYLRAVAEVCKKHNVLLIADEVQTGLGRTGRMLACDHEGVKPDILVLGKALSGGMMPVSAVCASSEIMLTVQPGQHGSTYGGNPLACAVAVEALKVLQGEGMVENAAARGDQLHGHLQALVAQFPHIFATTRGKGLLRALVVRPDAKTRSGAPLSAWDVCIGLKDAARIAPGVTRGLLAKPTQKHVIRLAPPLVMTREQVDECADIMRRVVTVLDA